MAWSTREIAELAGTTLRTVRHYHEVGLLEKPQRRANGYKQYGVAHLIRVLKIKRLAELGFSLTQIAAMGDDADHPQESLRSLDAELSATIERLQRIRVELALIIDQRTPTDLPNGFATVTGTTMSRADRSMVTVLTQVLGPARLRAYAQLLQDLPTDPTDGEFDALPPDADEPTRRDLAERRAPHIRDILIEHSGLLAPHSDAAGGERFVTETAATAMRDLYNPAQLDVIRRVEAQLADERPAPVVDQPSRWHSNARHDPDERAHRAGPNIP